MSKMIVDFKGKVVTEGCHTDLLDFFVPVKQSGDSYLPDYEREFDVKVVKESSVKLSRTEQLKELKEQLEDAEKRNSEEFNKRYKAEQRVRELEAKFKAIENEQIVKVPK